MASFDLVIAATTDAVTVTSAGNTDGYDSVVIAAPGLATTEECDIYAVTPGGNALWGVLTASAQAKQVPTGPAYVVAKDATAGAVPVYIIRAAGGSV